MYPPSNMYPPRPSGGGGSAWGQILDVAPPPIAPTSTAMAAPASAETGGTLAAPTSTAMAAPRSGEAGRTLAAPTSGEPRSEPYTLNPKP